MKRTVWIAAALLLAGCGRYADFTLPPTAGGNSNMSYDFVAHPDPILSRGGGPESRDVLNPSVVGHHMFYSAFDGVAWRTLHATSDDGLRWQKLGVILSPDPHTWEDAYIAANGTALFDGGQFSYWYVAGPRGKPSIGLARSADASSWHKETKPVLQPGPYQAWDEQGVADPYVVRVGRYLYLYYLGQDRARRQRLGLARSLDGIRWEKLRANPILELGDPGAFDENGLGEPAIWQAGGFYWMIYTGRDTAENRRMGLARSTDGVHWQKLPAVFAGTQPWDSRVVCDPTVEVNGSEIRVWFGGGDVADPERNLNGQIGYGILRPVNATLGK